MFYFWWLHFLALTLQKESRGLQPKDMGHSYQRNRTCIIKLITISLLMLMPVFAFSKEKYDPAILQNSPTPQPLTRPTMIPLSGIATINTFLAQTSEISSSWLYPHSTKWRTTGQGCFQGSFMTRLSSRAFTTSTYNTYWK